MVCSGIYYNDGTVYNAILEHSRDSVTLLLGIENKIVSAFHTDYIDTWLFGNTVAKNVFSSIKAGLAKCVDKGKKTNGSMIPFELGTTMMYTLEIKDMTYCIQRYNNKSLNSIEFLESQTGEHFKVNYDKRYADTGSILKDMAGVKWVKTTKVTKDIEEMVDSGNLDDIPVRSVEEIALEKEDVTWISKVKPYIVNDDATAEKIFKFLDTYEGQIAYDVETSGLRINCFSKINSKYARQLEKYNEGKDEADKIKVDYLVGIIFCVEESVSYYFPVKNRKFKNLYEDLESLERKEIIERARSRYKDGDLRFSLGDMKEYFLNNADDKISTDVVLMERVRDILHTKHITTHGGKFEWKVGWIYEIDTNICDDTMLMHQLMYKYAGGKGERSDLKYLSKKELGIDQWELADFFPSYKEDESGKTKSSGGKKRKAGKVDFSYMTYEGTKIYAPADGFCTFQLAMKYLADMRKNHKDLEYLYRVEVIVLCAIAYMEFYGHRIDENKIEKVRVETQADCLALESEIRQNIGFSVEKELNAYSELKEALNNKADKAVIIELSKKLREAIDSDEEHEINLKSPGQVAELLYDVIGCPSNNSRSVDKKAIKTLLSYKDDSGNAKYPVVVKYAEYKKKDTLITKFFDNLQNFMYPGGLVFSSYGQIDAATGRMNCKKPNAQQYPKSVAKIVIPRDQNVMIDSDYSQIEYRVTTGLAKEPYLIELFKDPDNDYHTLMASLMFGVLYAAVTSAMRGDAKGFNFGIPYGMGFKSLALRIKGRAEPQDIEEAKLKYELYFKNQPNVRYFFSSVKEKAAILGYTKTMFNRVRSYVFTNADGSVNNSKKAAALRQAGNAVIQGTAADIFKMSVARMFLYIRKNYLFEKFFIINMIHDEQLMEADVSQLNILRLLHDIKDVMQMNIEGLPPLYIGAGVGPSWAEAKGKMTEIHPHELDQIYEQASKLPLRLCELPEDSEYRNLSSKEFVLKYMQNHIINFRTNKIKDYLTNEKNWNQEMHPVIGSLLNLQFTYGHDKDKEKLTDAQFNRVCLQEFIKHQGLDLDDQLFKITDTNEVEEAKEDEDDYDDSDESSEEADEELEAQFKLIDESNAVYGCTTDDYLKTFHVMVSSKHGMCGIDTRNSSVAKIEALITYLLEHECDDTDAGAMEVTFLKPGDITAQTGLYVKKVSTRELEKYI